MNKKSIKKNLLIVWVVASLGWLVLSWNFVNADRAVKAYKTMLTYENMILAGNNTKAMREMYIRASENIDKSAQVFALFLLMGFGVPWGTFVLGNLWLQRRLE